MVSPSNWAASRNTKTRSYVRLVTELEKTNSRLNTCVSTANRTLDY